MIHALMAGIGLPKLQRGWKREYVIGGMVMLNLPIALYTSYIHQRGVVDVVNWLRKEHYNSSEYVDSLPWDSSEDDYPTHIRDSPPNTYNRLHNETYGGRWATPYGKRSARVGFLMPCHSTPFGSHLWDAGMKNTTHGPQTSAWFITCEPPIGLSTGQRQKYLDDADRFYDNQTSFLASEIGPPPNRTDVNQRLQSIVPRWSDKLVMFDAMSKPVKDYLLVGHKDGRYRECKRFFNSHWHDDWRRRGDVIVFCLGD